MLSRNKLLEYCGVGVAIFYALFIAANLELEFIGFALLLLSSILLGIWSHLEKHKGMLILQFFYAATAILGMVRWF